MVLIHTAVSIVFVIFDFDYAVVHFLVSKTKINKQRRVFHVNHTFLFYKC